MLPKNAFLAFLVALTLANVVHAAPLQADVITLQRISADGEESSISTVKAEDSKHCR